MFDFLTIGKALKNFAGELQSLRIEIEMITREIEDIQYAPAHMDDVNNALEAWAADAAGTYLKHFKSVINPLVASPGFLLNTAGVRQHLSAREFLPTPSFHTPMSRDAQMCGLLGPSVFVGLIKKQIEGLDWPIPGLLMAARIPAIEALEKKISKLRSREAELIRSADKAGLVIS